MSYRSYNYVSEVRKLSPLFYQAYPLEAFPEIERKSARGYETLLVERREDYYICIPFRSHITHKNAFLFRESVRSRNHASGLDYSKICIIKNEEYIDPNPGVIDHDEYSEMQRNLDRIVGEACEYIDKYVAHIKGYHTLERHVFQRKYMYTTLKYFHNELEL